MSRERLKDRVQQLGVMLREPNSSGPGSEWRRGSVRGVSPGQRIRARPTVGR